MSPLRRSDRSPALCPLLPAPCCSVGFAPWDDRLLVYAEEAKHVHLRSVPEPAAGGGGGCLEQNARDGEGRGAGWRGHGRGPAACGRLLLPAAAPASPHNVPPLPCPWAADLADAPPALQLLRLPVLPAGHRTAPDPGEPSHSASLLLGKAPARNFAQRVWKHLVSTLCC